MPTTGDIVAKMVASLRASDPNLDTSVGTPVRKILDAVGESVAEAYTDQHLITYFYDIDSKIEADLDDFVALFGFARIPAQRSQGVVTFTRPNDKTAQDSVAVIAVGTQVAALSDPPVYAQTTISSVMDPGQLTVGVPVQALLGGSTGNLASGAITTMAAQNSTITRVTNVNPLSGGSDQESDDALRARFKATVFRSLAGTEAMYRAVAMEVPQDRNDSFSRAVAQVNVIGSTLRMREQLQLVSGHASIMLSHAAFIYSDSVVVGADIDAGSTLTAGVNYTFTASNPTDGTDATAVLSSIDATNMPDGFYDVYFEYVPQASRNDPAGVRFSQGAVNNRIDLWCTGTKAVQATQSVVVDRNRVFSASRTSPYYNQKFRMNAVSPIPPINRIFIPVAFGPIVEVPDSISVGGTTYYEGTDYWIVHQDDAFGYTANSYYGLAWLASRVPAQGATFSLTYSYNSVPRDVQDAINVWRLVGTDCRAHQGKQVQLRFHFAIMYDRRFNPAQVNTAVDTAIASWLSSLGFAANLQISDVIQVVHNVPGVDNVRFLTSTDDSTSYAITQMSPFQANYQVGVYSNVGRAVDILFDDATYPVFHSTRIVQRGINNFRSAS
jgi:uncharacterized phage protein gp47/JayE